MWNIMRAQIYQTMRNKMTWFIFFFAIALNAVFSFGFIVDNEEGLNGSLTVASLGSMYCMTGLLFLMVFAADITGKDFTDKTINYEILSGHSRNEVFFGRFIVAAVVGSIGALFIMLLFPCLITLLSGWGNTMELQGVVFRYILVFVTLFRVVCEVTLITFLTKNPYITYLTGFLFGYIQMLLPMAQSEFPDWFINKNSVSLSVWHCLDLLDFQDWTTFFLDESEQILYQSGVEPVVIGQTIGVSLLVGVVLLVISFVFFHSDDLN